MNRRQFFKEMSDTAIHAAAESPHPPTPSPSGRGGGIDDGQRFPAPSSLPVRSTPGSPRQYQPGARVLITESLAWLCCDDLGFYALDAHCPHLGGIVQIESDAYACPCHSSRFDASGGVTSGPAKRGLRYLYVDLNADGNLVIRRDRAAALPDDRLIA
jgi:Rieske Fe-S protein